MLAACVLLATTLAAQQEPPAATPPAPVATADQAAETTTGAADAEVANVLEELRAAELLLDGDRMASRVARSFTVIEGGARTAGRFAYLEALRRMHARGADVRRLAFNDTRIEVFGASAVATYQLRKVWTDEGQRRTQEGWSTDVFERRNDGAWLLVHRHRP